MDSLDHLKRLLGPLERRLRTYVMRATLERVDDTKDLQRMQLTRLEGETIDDCERVGQWGFTSVPPKGSELIVAQIGSNSDHQVVIGVDDKSRPHPLADGQTVIYDKAGTVIRLLADGTVEIVGAGRITLNGGDIVLVGSTVHVFGDLSVTGAMSLGGALLGDLHVTGDVDIDGSLSHH